MSEAAFASSKRPQARQLLPRRAGRGTLNLFAKWCQCIRIEAPAGLSDDERGDLYCEAGDRADWFYHAIGQEFRAGAASNCLEMAALLWVTFWHKGEFVDATNPCLPHPEKARWHRDMVNKLAAEHPELAQIAGVAA